MDTHIFDGKYDPKVLDKEILSITDEHTFDKIVDVITDPLAKTILNTLIVDAGRPPNFDPLSGLWADILLKLCCNFIENSDFVDILQTQLIEMYTGMCSQGRVTRLYQLLVAFYEK